MPTHDQDLYSKVQLAVEHLKKIFRWAEPQKPRLAVILGSGLGDFAETLQTSRRIPFSDVPHFPLSSVTGHLGHLILGRSGETWLICLQGRAHFYEGHEMSAVTFPVRVLGALGVKRLIVTNAAGSINRRFRPGDLLLLSDHISSFIPNPLVGPNLEGLGPRFPDMSECYSLRLRQVAQRCAQKLKFTLREGVYVSLTGPSYESPAEIQMLRKLGADAVGMSTVPEVIVARHMGMECLGLSLITNLAAGISQVPLSHQEVLEAGKRMKPKLVKFLVLLNQEISKLE